MPTGSVRKSRGGAGLYYFRSRWLCLAEADGEGGYDPVTGRWLSNDPIGISGGLNQYAFCANNPVMFVDPEGKVVWAVAKAAVTAWAKETLTTAVITGSVGAALGGIDMNGGKLGWSWSEAGAGFVAGFAGGFVEGRLKPFSPYLGTIAGATTYQEVSIWMTGTELPSSACGLLFGTTGYWLNLNLKEALARGEWWAYVSGTGVQIVVELLAEVFESMQEAACE